MAASLADAQQPVASQVGAGDSSRLVTGGLALNTSDPNLAAAFQWAHQQALAYAFTGDAVGNWYEAALPGREAFCMRDIAHQAMGAHALGLARYTRNMLRKFAENISDSKDWCSYWEINRSNLPAPVDYEDDAHFWYNLPANFDVLDACYRMYVWTGDRTYIDDPIFLNFYKRTVHDYVERWDLGLEGIMTRQRILNIRGRPDPDNRFQSNRGIPSYEETDRSFVVAADQLAVQYAAYRSYARFRELREDHEEARQFLRRAEEVKSFLNRVWWDNTTRNYYSRVDLNHKLVSGGLNLALLYYGAAEDGPKAASVLDAILRSASENRLTGVEAQSHLPEILYRYGKPEAAYEQILDLTREGKNRREYPEVSYSVIGAVVTGLMGIELEAAEPERALRESRYVDRTIVTLPRLSQKTEWAEINNVPVRVNELRVRHERLNKTILSNQAGPSLVWKACFPGSFTSLLIDEKGVKAEQVTAAASGQPLTCTTVNVAPGTRVTVQAP